MKKTKSTENLKGKKNRSKKPLYGYVNLEVESQPFTKRFSHQFEGPKAPFAYGIENQPLNLQIFNGLITVKDNEAAVLKKKIDSSLAELVDQEYQGPSSAPKATQLE